MTTKTKKPTKKELKAQQEAEAAKKKAKAKKKAEYNHPPKVVPPPVKPMPLYLGLLRPGDWFKLRAPENEPPTYGVVEKTSDGEVTVQLHRHYGEPSTARIFWSPGTAVFRLKEKPAELESKPSEEVVKAEKAKKENKPPAPKTDALGCLPNKASGRINAVIDTPKTLEQVAKETGLPEKRIKVHMDHWIKKGGITKTKDGKYVLAVKKEK